MNFIDKLGRWFLLVLDLRPPYETVFVEDAPDQFDEKFIYLIGEDGQAWAAMFICPCGCKEVISLSLILKDKPSWLAKLNRSQKLTLKPSIRRVKGCLSHFFIREGKVVWAKDDRRKVKRP